MKISFIKEIEKCIDLTDFFCVQLRSSGGVIFGVKKILECEAQKIEVVTQNKKLVAVRGESLAVTKVCEGDLFFSGKIRGVDIE